MFPSVNIFGKDIGINWVLIVISCIIMAVINVIRAKKYNLRKWHGVVIAILVNIFAIFSAILMYNLETINGDGFKMGLSFFGTVFFLPIFMFILSFLFKTKKDEFMDYWALTIPMELALVRFGCFLSGCCLGIQASHGVHFPFEPEGVYRVPVQLYEVIFDLLIFTGLIIVEKKINLKGILYPIFMVSYGFIRFILEFFRDTPKDFIGLSNGQIFAFVCVILGLALLVFLIKRKEKLLMNKKDL